MEGNWNCSVPSRPFRSKKFEPHFEPNFEPYHLNIALVGKTGDGKSKLGNVLLGKEVFQSVACAASVTFSCESGFATRPDGSEITIIDTPGTMDNRNLQVAQRNLAEAATMCPEGLDAFLLVTKYGRFTAESRKAIEVLAEMFGEDLFRYVIVVFTHAEEFDNRQQFDQAIQRDVSQNQDLKVILQKCSNRVTFIDNGKNCDKEMHATQVQEILSMISQIHASNNGKYTNWLFQKAQELLQEKKRREEEEEKRKEALKQREAQLLKSLEEIKAEMQKRDNDWREEMRKKENEMQNMERSQRGELQSIRNEMQQVQIQAQNKVKQQKQDSLNWKEEMRRKEKEMQDMERSQRRELRKVRNHMQAVLMQADYRHRQYMEHMMASYGRYSGSESCIIL